MAIVDAGIYQDWIRAFDNWERAQRRYDAAPVVGDRALMNYLHASLQSAAREYQAACRAIQDA
jgi:signal-transduction protein with cAMP-binding, CBS, and nucleotidyltransferase domain